MKLGLVLSPLCPVITSTTIWDDSSSYSPFSSQGRVVGVGIMGLICVSGIACVVETVPGWSDEEELW